MLLRKGRWRRCCSPFWIKGCWCLQELTIGLPLASAGLAGWRGSSSSMGRLSRPHALLCRDHPPWRPRPRGHTQALLLAQAPDLLMWLLVAPEPCLVVACAGLSTAQGAGCWPTPSARSCLRLNVSRCCNPLIDHWNAAGLIDEPRSLAMRDRPRWRAFLRKKPLLRSACLLVVCGADPQPGCCFAGDCCGIEATLCAGPPFAQPCRC